MLAADSKMTTAADADVPRLTREAPPPRDVDWVELLDLADRLNVTVWRLGPDGVLIPATPDQPQPPTEGDNQ